MTQLRFTLQNNHSIHLVKGASKSSAAATPSTPAARSTGTSTGTGVPSNMGTGMQFAGNPLAALEGVQGHGMGGGVFNPFATMGAGNLNDPNAVSLNRGR